MKKYLLSLSLSISFLLTLLPSMDALGTDDTLEIIKKNKKITKDIFAEGYLEQLDLLKKHLQKIDFNFDASMYKQKSTLAYTAENNTVTPVSGQKHKLGFRNKIADSITAYLKRYNNFLVRHIEQRKAVFLHAIAKNINAVYADKKYTIFRTLSLDAKLEDAVFGATTRFIIKTGNSSDEIEPMVTRDFLLKEVSTREQLAINVLPKEVRKEKNLYTIATNRPVETIAFHAVMGDLLLSNEDLLKYKYTPMDIPYLPEFNHFVKQAMHYEFLLASISLQRFLGRSSDYKETTFDDCEKNIFEDLIRERKIYKTSGILNTREKDFIGNRYIPDETTYEKRNREKARKESKIAFTNEEADGYHSAKITTEKEKIIKAAKKRILEAVQKDASEEKESAIIITDVTIRNVTEPLEEKESKKDD